MIQLSDRPRWTQLAETDYSAQRWPSPASERVTVERRKPLWHNELRPLTPGTHVYIFRVRAQTNTV